MSKIKVLPEILSNKIAAGEVVERPASVVKEIVENALDAQGTRIMIDIEKGGRSLIRVADNGIGMSRDDSLLSLERYATSKIYKDHDLFSIRTLGFRGEALPSIASVSHFCLITRPKISDTGTEITVEGGKIKRVNEVGAPVGTMITVKQLFYNVPARRKFLKTVNTEMSHVADTISCLALSSPGVMFRLSHNNRIVKNWSAVSDPLLRVIDVLGRDVENHLFEMKSRDEFISISGWISSTRMTRRTSRGIYLFVNGRYVRDRVIQHALFEGYRNRLVKGLFPVAVLFIKVPPDQVDVNVHPTKHEVRFVHQNKIHAAVKNHVRKVIKKSEMPVWTVSQKVEHQAANKIRQISDPVKPFAEYQQPDQVKADKYTVKEYPRKTLKISSKNIPVEEKKQVSFWPQRQLGHLKIIGTFRDTYLVCEFKDELIFIDQHAAHERIVYERLKERDKREMKTAQKLLIPETIDLGFRESNILKKILPELNEIGIEIEHFGGNTFIVKSVPSILGTLEIKPLVSELLEKLVSTGFSKSLEGHLDDCVKIIACHSALRANQRLSEPESRSLLEQLDNCEDPSHCPHGRPTWIYIRLKSLEKSFQRIVSDGFRSELEI